MLKWKLKPDLDEIAVLSNKMKTLVRWFDEKYPKQKDDENIYGIALLLSLSHQVATQTVPTKYFSLLENLICWMWRPFLNIIPSVAQSDALKSFDKMNVLALNERFNKVHTWQNAKEVRS
jgi:hypothetical protein